MPIVVTIIILTTILIITVALSLRGCLLSIISFFIPSKIACPTARCVVSSHLITRSLSVSSSLGPITTDILFGEPTLKRSLITPR